MLTGGCGDSTEPLLITRRDQSLGDVGRAEQAAPGVGTYSVCGTGATWAGMAKDQEKPGEPWTYTIAAVGVRPCEGAYVDSTDKNFITTRKQPESTTVTATVTFYSALQTVPAGEPVAFQADVPVVNAKSLDNARFEGGPDADYKRPSPFVLGTVTLPPIGSSADDASAGAESDIAGSDAGSAVEPFDWRTGITAADSSGRAVQPDDPDEASPKVWVRYLGGKRVRYTQDQETDTWRLMTEGEIAGYHAELDELLEGFEDDPQAEPTLLPAAAPAPSKDPPEMKGRAKKQQREWVSMPAPAIIYETYPSVAKRKLKTGVWYQMKVNDDGSRDFFSKKGNWLGTSPIDDRDKVEVRVRSEEVVE